jgi:hypothetical protein
MRFIIFAWCFLALSAQAARAGNILIKSEEAALPTSTNVPKTASGTRALTRRPDIFLVSPARPVSSPFDLRLKFQAHGGSSIKPESFHLIYLKNPVVDLTARVRPFVTPNGVDMPEAEAPAGTHMIEARISDSSDREFSGVFVLNVK